MLEKEVRVVRLSRRARHTLLPSLLRVLFYPDGSHKQGILSYSESSTELTLVLEKEPYELLRKDSPVLEEGGLWRVMRITAGPSGFDPTAVSNISLVLAQAKISILYQATFSMDLVLVPAECLVSAAVHLHMAGFTVQHDQGDLVKLPDFMAEMEKQRDTPTSKLSSLKPHRYPVHVLPPELKLVKLSGPLDKHIRALIDILFLRLDSDGSTGGGKDVPRVLSIVIIEGEMSLILPVEAVAKLDTSSAAVNVMEESFRAVYVGAQDVKIGFEETGIVASQSASLVQHSIPVVFFSLYSAAIALIPRACEAKAMEVLSSNFTVRSGFVGSFSPVRDLLTATSTPQTPSHFSLDGPLIGSSSLMGCSLTTAAGRPSARIPSIESKDEEEEGLLCRQMRSDASGWGSEAIAEKLGGGGGGLSGDDGDGGDGGGVRVEAGGVGADVGDGYVVDGVGGSGPDALEAKPSFVTWVRDRQ